MVINGKFDSAPIEPSTFAAEQWSQQSLLGGFGDELLGEEFTSMNELGMDFIKNPELSAPGIFSVEQAETLLKRDITSSSSLVNPEAMWNNSFLILTGETNPDYTDDQVTALRAYLEEQLKGTKFQAEGTIVTKALQLSYKTLEDTLLGELATRNVAYLINNVDKTNCDDILTTVCGNELSANMCSKYSFADLDDLRLFMNATWYSEKSEILNAGLTELCYNKLYDASIS